MTPDDLLNQREAARLLGVAEQTIERWRKAGKLTPIQRNGKGRKYYLRSQLLGVRSVTAGNTPPPPPPRPRRVRTDAEGEQLDLVDLAREPGISPETVQELFALGGAALRIQFTRRRRVIAGGSQSEEWCPRRDSNPNRDTLPRAA